MCDENSNQGTGSKSISLWWLLPLFAVVALVQFLSWQWMIGNIGEGATAWTVRGQFGDMFGAVNTLFSGLAFAGVIFAIILQSRELTLQREELALSRTVNLAAAEAQAEQADLLERASKIKVIEKEIEIEIAFMKIVFGNIHFIHSSGARQKKLGELEDKLPSFSMQLNKLVANMRKLTQMGIELPDPPTPQQ